MKLTVKAVLINQVDKVTKNGFTFNYLTFLTTGSKPEVLYMQNNKDNASYELGLTYEVEFYLNSNEWPVGSGEYFVNLKLGSAKVATSSTGIPIPPEPVKLIQAKPLPQKPDDIDTVESDLPF